jgi:hypothetical protein
VSLRWSLRALAAICLATGAFAELAPHAFYRHVVGVDMLGPYNEHLLTDVGGFYLGFALLFAWGARRPSPELAQAACAAFALTQALHVAFHLAHLHGCTRGQAIAQTAALMVLVVLPATALILARRPPAQTRGRPAARE